MKLLLPPSDARDLALAYLKRVEFPDDVRQRIRGSIVAIVGTGPSAGDTKRPHGVCVSLNGAHAYHTTKAFHIGFGVDHSDDTPNTFGDGSCCEHFLIPDAAPYRRELPKTKVTCLPSPLPISPKGSQSLAVWIFAALGASGIELYGCDSVFGDARNIYDGEYGAPPAHWLYAMQPRWARTLAGSCPLTWIRGQEWVTHREVQAAPVKIIPLWHPMYYQMREDRART